MTEGQARIGNIRCEEIDHLSVYVYAGIGAYRQTVVHDRIRKATAAAEIEHVELPKVGHSEALAHILDQQCFGFPLRVKVVIRVDADKTGA
jgi:hypothetical protein